MKKWRMIACVFCAVGLLTACGSSEDNIQLVEQEDIVKVSEPEAEEIKVPEEEELRRRMRKKRKAERK